MKLKELLQSSAVSTYETLLVGELLLSLKDKLLSLDEFEGVKDIVVEKYPSCIIDNNPHAARSYKIGTNTNFKDFVDEDGILHLYNITVSPATINFQDIFKAAQEHPISTHAIYCERTFEPRKYIVMSYSPESLQDQFVLPTNEDNNKFLKKTLLEQFSDILDNPEKYTAPKRRYIFVRLFNMNTKTSTPFNYLQQAEIDDYYIPC